MTHVNKLAELDRKQRKAWKDYEQSKDTDGIGEPKFIDIVKDCLDQRLDMMQRRFKSFSTQINEIKS